MAYLMVFVVGSMLGFAGSFVARRAVGRYRDRRLTKNWQEATRCDACGAWTQNWPDGRRAHKCFGCGQTYDGRGVEHSVLVLNTPTRADSLFRHDLC